jgi:ubiquinone/menaquinone biosynthesis C-methylase UbiE
MHLHHLRRLVTPLALVLLATLASGQSAQQNLSHAEWLIKNLEIHEGSAVGEIGAGDGELTVAMAKAVGPTGKVFSNELNKERLAALAGVAEKAGVKNVTPIEGRESETNFADQCCDAIFMRNVYHHFADPAAMDASLFKSLKPGGRLAVLDFTPPGAEADKPSGRSADGFHGVKAQTVARELVGAGFEVISAVTHNREVEVVARRPPPQ